VEAEAEFPIEIDSADSSTYRDISGREVGYSCFDTPGTMKSGMILALGYSDDKVAERLISQCVGAIDVFGVLGTRRPYMCGS
jgi:hypothetical protein